MLNFTSLIQTIIIYVLISLLVASTSAYIYKHFENSTLKTKLNTKNVDIVKILNAERSCKKTLKEMIASEKKKKEILKKYNKTMGGYRDENVTNISKFIDFAKRLY